MWLVVEVVQADGGGGTPNLVMVATRIRPVAWSQLAWPLTVVSRVHFIARSVIRTELAGPEYW
jgi:hypothetical protein